MADETSHSSYTQPVAELLTLGTGKQLPFTYNYLRLGFTDADIPELIRLATDETLHSGKASDFATWGALHAWRTLGQLRATAAIEPLLSLYEKYAEDDWVTELADVFAQIGTACLPYLEAYIHAPHADDFSVLDASSAIVAIGLAHPDVYTQCVHILMDKLAKFNENAMDINGGLVADLVELDALEAIEVIRYAYEAQRVDPVLAGNLGDVEVELGLELEAPEYDFDLDPDDFLPDDEALDDFLETMAAEGLLEPEEPNIPQKAKYIAGEDVIGMFFEQTSKPSSGKRTGQQSKGKKDKHQSYDSSKKKKPKWK
jgi:hypothetical protein